MIVLNCAKLCVAFFKTIVHNFDRIERSLRKICFFPSAVKSVSPPLAAFFILIVLLLLKRHKPAPRSKVRGFFYKVHEMLKNENMYKQVYFLSFRNKTILTGRIIATEISDNGYIMHTVKTKDNLYSIDDAIVFDDLKEAEQSLEKWQPINNEIIRLTNSTNDTIDRLRETINGKPHFPEYAASLKGK